MLQQETGTWYLNKQDLNQQEQEDDEKWLKITSSTLPEQLSVNNNKTSSSTRSLFIQLTPNPLKLGELYNFCVAPCCGAVSSFVGTTRDIFEGKPVEKLEYEVYAKMAETQIAKIGFEMFNRWADLRRIVISHRSGEVGICHPSVVIHVSSVHRRQGLEACQYAIDTLKADVPIWKREFYRRERDDQEESELLSVWKANSECLGCRHKHHHKHGEETEEKKNETKKQD